MKKFSAICLVSSALLLLTFFIFLFLAIRPDPDDMIISLDIREHSMYYALKMRYLLSSFRTTLILSEGLALGSNDPAKYPWMLFAYYFLVFGLLIFSVYKLITHLLAPSLFNLRDKLLLMATSVVIGGAIYFLCTCRIEVFGWLGASGGHLVPMAFSLLAAVILLEKRAFVFNYILLAVCAFVIAGGAEHINVIVVLLNAAVIYSMYRKQLVILHKTKLVFFTITQFVLFAIFFSNPGVWHRVHDVSVAQGAGYDSGNFFLMFFQPYKLVGILLAFFSAFVVKERFAISVPKVSVKALVATGAIIFLICFLMGLAAYHSCALGRIWFPFDVYLTFLFFFIGLKMSATPLIKNVTAAAGAFLITFICYRHIPALNRFRAGFDQVVEKITKAQAGETIVIDEFPEPDLVNLVDLSPDPENEINTLFCRFYNSKATISVKQNYSKSR